MSAAAAWEQQQRAFQARALMDGDTPIQQRAYRTMIANETATTVTRLSWLELAAVVLTGTLTTALIARALDAPRLVLFGIVGLAMLIVLLAAFRSSPRPAAIERTWVLAVYDSSVAVREAPSCIARIAEGDVVRLGTDGIATVIGNPTPGESFGVFVDDYLVWPQSPPRRARPDEAPFGR